MEVLDIVDESDQVIGKAPYENIYSKLLPHRIVHVLIFDKKRLLLQSICRISMSAMKHTSEKVNFSANKLNLLFTELSSVNYQDEFWNSLFEYISRVCDAFQWFNISV